MRKCKKIRIYAVDFPGRAERRSLIKKGKKKDGGVVKAACREEWII